MLNCGVGFALIFTPMLCVNPHPSRSLLKLILAWVLCTSILVFAESSRAQYQEQELSNPIQEPMTSAQTETAVMTNEKGSLTVTEFRSENPNQVLSTLKAFVDHVYQTDPKQFTPENTTVLVAIDSIELAHAVWNMIPRGLRNNVLVIPEGELAIQLGIADDPFRLTLNEVRSRMPISERIRNRAASTYNKIKNIPEIERASISQNGQLVGALTTLRVIGGTVVTLYLTNYATGARWTMSGVSALLTYLWTYHDAFVTRWVKNRIAESHVRQKSHTAILPSDWDRMKTKYTTSFQTLAGTAWGTMTTLGFVAIASWDQVLAQFTHPEVWFTIMKAASMAGVGTLAWLGWNLYDVKVADSLHRKEITELQFQRYRLFRGIQSLIVGLGGPLLTEWMFPSSGFSTRLWHEIAIVGFVGNGVAGALVHTHAHQFIAKWKTQPWWPKVVAHSQRLLRAVADLAPRPGMSKIIVQKDSSILGLNINEGSMCTGWLSP